ncbi:MAG TPA: IS4 family transposase [Schlesneria sp.]|jgi:transposase
MSQGQVVFSQLMEFIPRRDFRECVQRYQGEHRVRQFSCRDQFLSMVFAQLTFRESLRDIETCLKALQPKLYHAGFRSQVHRSTLADANEHRDWQIYADFAQVLIRRARRLYADNELPVSLDQTVYALDSTTIDLCLALFPWARFRKRKGAVKLHTVIDLRGSIPCFVHVSHGKTHDVTALDHLTPEPGAFYVMDKGYVDFRRLQRLQDHSAFFLLRAKRNMQYTRRQRRVVDKSTGLRCDQTIALNGPKSSRLYPGPLRRIGYWDAENDKRFVFLTNDFNLPALTIAELYRSRWKIELFFKWIKQHLRIKAFYGHSINAVKTQVWIAIIAYVLIAIIKKELDLAQSPYEILQIISLSLFEKTPLKQLFQPQNIPNPNNTSPNQLTLFDF